jgi:uncharacterized protein (DUF58 family)
MVIFWLIVVTIAMVLVQSIIYKQFGLSKLEYNREFTPTAVFEDEEAEMVEEIINKKLLPIPWIKLESNLPSEFVFKRKNELNVISERFHVSLFSLLPYEKITRRHRFTCTKRGYYWFETVSITCGDPLGFYQPHELKKLWSEILVYPKIIPIHQYHLNLERLFGEHVIKRWMNQDPFNLAHVREYQPQDSLQRINWKKTAQTQELMVNQPEDTIEFTFNLLLNVDDVLERKKVAEDDERLEEAIMHMASFAQFALNQGIKTGIGSNAYSTNPYQRNASFPMVKSSSQKGQLRLILEWLAKLRGESFVPFDRFLFEQVVPVMQNSEIFIFTRELTQGMRRYIKQLERNHNTVEIIYFSSLDVKGVRQHEREEEMA